MTKRSPVFALAVSTLFLAGCQTVINEPVFLYPPYRTPAGAPVNPTLNLPGAGFHGAAGAGMADDETLFSDSDFSGYDGTVSLLIQGDLTRPGVSPFGSLSANIAWLTVEGTPSYEDLGTVTNEERNLARGRSSDKTVDVTARLGAALHLDPRLISVYGIVGGFVEQGEYFDVRRRLDGVGNLFNTMADPSFLYAGGGMDGSVRGPWGLGAGTSIEAVTFRTRTQSYVSSTSETVTTPGPFGDETTKTYYVKTSLRGREDWGWGLTFQGYVEWYGLRVYGTWPDLKWGVLLRF